MTDLSKPPHPDAALIAQLTNAIGRVDRTSLSGFAFRSHVVKTDLLPLVQKLIADARKQVADEIAEALKVQRTRARDEGHRGWPLLTEAAVIAREIGRQS
jgi:hypothetical protein